MTDVAAGRAARHGPPRLGLALTLVMALTLAPRLALAAALPPLPAGWPGALHLGLADRPGGAAALRATAPFGFRYQYLSGGVNTGPGGTSARPAGGFVPGYIQESVQAGFVPVFTYYMLIHSWPGRGQGEMDAVYSNLQNRDTMAAYYADLKRVFQEAGTVPGRLVVLHVEPDVWGYLQQRSGDGAASVFAHVASTGVPELAGLPDTAAGFARAFVRLRDAYAPGVRLAYHMSLWGTNADITTSNLPDATVDHLATRAAGFFNSLQAAFDLVFAEYSDRDAAYYQYVRGDGGASWWAPDDFGRHVRFLAHFVATTRKRVILWQIPLGNTRMRAMNNTWNHFQDNRVEWLLDDPGRGHLQAYTDAGVVAFLFGHAADGNTCACDASGDGITNPEPINGNTRLSLTADDDGGLFRQKAAEYYGAGAIPLPSQTGPIPPPAPVAPIVTGAGPGGGPHVRAFATGASFSAFDPRFAGGVFVAVGDADGDGRPEIVVGAGAGGGPHVRLFRPDGSPLGVEFFAYAPTFAGGVRVAACDLDGAGRAAIVTAAGPGGGPHVRIWTLAGAGVVERAGFHAYSPTFTGGVHVACADLDGDGRAEIVTGADTGGGPHVRVFRLTGNVASPVAELFAYTGTFRGGVRVAAGDVDGDGRAEVITAAGPGGGPHVRVFRLVGAAWVDLGGFYAYAPGFTGGVFVAAGQVTGDVRAEIVTGAGPGGGPHVRVWRLEAGGAVEQVGFFAYDLGFTGGVIPAVGP